MVYAYQPVNPLEGFAQGFQFVQGIKGQQQQQLRQQALQQALSSVRENPTPQNIAEFGLQFPEMKDQLDGYYNTLSEAKRNTQAEATERVVMASITGRPEQIPDILDRYADAAERSRDMQTAQEFRDAAEIARVDPEAAANLARVRLAMSNEKAYDRIYNQTAAMQNFEYFKDVLGPEKAEEIAGITPKDGLQILPNGMVIAGPDSPLAKQFSGGGGLQTVTTAEQYNALPSGAEYIDPSGVRRVKGGAGSNASGSFR